MLGHPELPIVRATQVHGTATHIVREEPTLGETRDAGERDVLATDRRSVGLVVQTADCAPILLAGARTVGAIHAGWRGAARQVAIEGVGALVRLGEQAANVRAWIGPMIGPCCYEVGREVATQFAGDFSQASGDGRFKLDLPAVTRAQLEAAGVPAANISFHGTCTRCGGEKYASYRRDGTAAGRMIALIARLP